MMTDKEKIEKIIQDKHLNNTQFCNEVCIAPGTLSHIRSGRTEPTLNILRSIVQAFPDINPAWLFYGEEPMYKNDTSPTPEDVSSDAHINNVEGVASAADDSMPLLPFASGDGLGHKNKGANVHAGQVAAGNAPATGGASQPSPRQSLNAPSVSMASFNVQEIVAETLKQQQRPQRKVVEVRIFFDDGTFETFSAK
ncbi:MAG: helix-turn-helix transcriptional regulator [Bacteroidaceae bacterium]|nr:helix-turn-helix transcriptional regulator [Bacteroidaceae bacterium]